MVKDLEEFAKDPLKNEQVNKWAMDFMQYMFTRSQEIIIENGTSDTSGLLISGNPPYEEDNKIKISYDAPHAMPIEYGTEPHMPPVTPIMRWVQRKLGVHNRKKAYSIAWAIATKIKKHGTDAQPFLRPAMNDTTSAYGLVPKASKVD